MNKIDWVRHMIDSEGLRRIIDGGDPLAWTQARIKHQREGCSVCQARRVTRRANQRARNMREAYADAGLVRAVGALGGGIYE